MDPPTTGQGTPAGDGRHETRDEQLDRNWNELLQELRVMQTGVQIIAGFLLTLPFQQKFGQLDEVQRATFLGLVLVAAAATGAMLTPVSLHRLMFRRHEKAKLVAFGNTILKVSLALVALLIAGSAGLIFSVVAGGPAGAMAGFGILALLASLLLVLPIMARRRGPAAEANGDSGPRR